MEPNGSDGLPGSDEHALEVRVQALLAQHGAKALQCIIDDIQQALHLGDEAAAEESAQLLRLAEQMIGTRHP